MASLTLQFQTVSIPTGSGGASVTIYEDVGNDGSGPSSDPNGRPYDNSDTVTLSDGVTEYTTGDVFSGVSGDAVWIRPQLGPPSDVTVTGATVVPASVTAIGPNAPSNLAASQGPEGEVDLSWTDNATTEDGYYVYRAQASGSTTGDYSQVADLAADTTTYTDTGLSDGETYYYRVSAYSGGGESSLSNEDSATTVLPPASGLGTGQPDSTSVPLSWTVNADSGTQSVEYKESSAGSWTTYSSGLALATSSATVTGLSPNTSYDFRVGTTTSDAATVYSGTVTDTTTPAAPPNLTISEVTATPDISLSWDAVSGVDEYRVYRATSPGTTTGDYTQIDTVGAGVTSYTDTSVSVETTYYYRVSAWNTNGESSPSRERRARVGDGFTDSVSWDTETEWGYGVFSDTTTDGSGALVLGDIASPQTFDYSLSASEDASVGGFTTVTAEIRDASSGTVLDSDTIHVSNDGDSRTGTFTIDTGTHPDLEFYVEVDLDNSGGGSDGSASISGPVDYTSGTIVSASRNSNAGTTTDTQTNTYTYTESGSWTSPAWDYGSTTTATRLSWSNVTLPNPGDTLTVTITEVGGGTTVQVSPTAGSGSELFDLAPGDTYRVTVDMSTVDDDTTPEVGSLTLETHTPTANLTVTDTRDAEIDLAWDAVSVADGYEVYQSETTPVDTGDSLAYSNTDPTTTTATITGLENGEQYYHNVRTSYTTGFSDLNGETSATTTLPSPSLSSLTVSGDDITATYTRNDNSTDGDVAIETSTDGGSTWTVSGTQSDLSASTVEAVDLLDETQYDVRVTRRTDHTESPSNTLSATTMPFTGINVATRSVSFGWEDPDGFAQDGYSIERRQPGVSPYQEVADVGPTVGAYTDSGLIPNTEYEWRVTAYTSGGSTEEAGSGTFTTLGGGQTPRVTSSGWSVSVTHPESGREIHPDVINPQQVQYLPGPNMMPEIRLPVRRAPAWLREEYDDNPNLSVHLNGTELPIDELVSVEQDEGQTILVGKGGAELRTRVSLEYDTEERPVAATNLVDANTSYASVDNTPAPDSDTSVVQSPDTQSELAGFLSGLPDTTPIEAVGGGIKPAVTCFTQEGETPTSNTLTGSASNVDYSGGSAIILSDGSTATYDFDLAYTIPSSAFAAQYRVTEGGSGTAEIEVYLDKPGGGSTLLDTIPSGVSFTSITWITDAFGDTTEYDDGDLTPGTYTLRFEGVGGSSGQDFIIDVVAPYDDRYTYTFDDTVHQDNGYLDGPELHPPEVDAIFDAYQSAFSIVGGSATVTASDTSGAFALALSNDRGQTYPITSSNSTTVSGSFPSVGATLQLRATLARYSPNGARSATPRFGYDAQRLDSYDLTATTEFESLLIDEEVDATLTSALNTILGNQFSWTYSIEDGQGTITIDEPGNSVADRDPEISEASITKQVQTYDTVTIKGSALPQSESFTASTSYVPLGEDNIVIGSETVTDPQTSTQYQKDIDYEMNYSTGEIKAIQSGDLVAGQDYDITYRHRIEATHTVPTATGDTLIETIPGVVSDRQAEQIAYVLAEVYPGVSTPRYEGNIVVPRLSESFDPLEGLRLEDMDLPDAARPLEIRGEPQVTPLGLSLRLGSAPSLQAALSGISEQVSALSDRV